MISAASAIRFPSFVKERECTYHQECSNSFAYDVLGRVDVRGGRHLIGCWTVSPNRPPLSKETCDLACG
jgi:hypothetical protein